MLCQLASWCKTAQLNVLLVWSSPQGRLFGGAARQQPLKGTVGGEEGPSLPSPSTAGPDLQQPAVTGPSPALPPSPPADETAFPQLAIKGLPPLSGFPQPLPEAADNLSHALARHATARTIPLQGRNLRADTCGECIQLFSPPREPAEEDVLESGLLLKPSS